MYPAYQPADAYGSGVHEEYEDDQVAIPPPLKFKSSTTPESAEAEGEGEGESEGRKKVQKKVVKKVKKKVEKKIEKKGTTDKRRNFRPVRQNGKGASAPPSGWDSEDSFMRSDSGSED
jgi:hypothetical protein